METVRKKFTEGIVPSSSRCSLAVKIRPLDAALSSLITRRKLCMQIFRRFKEHAFYADYGASFLVDGETRRHVVTSSCNT